MAELFGFDTGLNVGDIVSSRMGTYIMLGLIILVILIIGAGFLWWYLNKKLYKYKIAVFENIAGMGWRLSYRDKAKPLRLSADGTEVLFLKQKKMPITAYGKKMGPNEYWFAIAQDGGWYNIILGDLDAQNQILDIEPIDRDVKYISVAMRKNAQENYGPKVTFMDRYGAWIMGGVTIIILLAGVWFLIDKMNDTSAALTIATNEFTKIVEPISRALAHADSICSGGTGISPAENVV